MRVDFVFLDDVWVLRLRGRFNTGSNADFSNTSEQVQHAGIRKLVISCQELPYVDSTGIAFIIGLYNQVTNSGGTVVLAAVNSRVRDILNITQLTRVMAMYPDENAALSALAAEPVIVA